MKELEIIHRQLFADISQLIEESRQRVSFTVNAEVTILYWNIGEIVRTEILKQTRAEYGGQVILKLSEELSDTYGQGWSKRHLHHCIRFAEVFPDGKIVHTLCSQLSWSQLRIIISIDDELKRMFYIEMSKVERWSVRVLQDRINSLLYERTAISKKPEETIRKELEQLKNVHQPTPDLVFRDPYVLDFLGLKNSYSEKDLENSIVAELQRFITELGHDFAFLARQWKLPGREWKI